MLASGKQVSNLKVTENTGTQKNPKLRWCAVLLFTLRMTLGIDVRLLNNQCLEGNSVFAFQWGVSSCSRNKKKPMLQIQYEDMFHITYYSIYGHHKQEILKERDISFSNVSWWNQIKLLCQTAVIRQHVCLTSPEKSWATQFNYNNNKNCKHHCLSSLYVCGHEDNVLSGNKSALTATSKGAVRGLLPLKAQECCC